MPNNARSWRVLRLVRSIDSVRALRSWITFPSFAIDDPGLLHNFQPEIGKNSFFLKKWLNDSCGQDVSLLL